MKKDEIRFEWYTIEALPPAKEGERHQPQITVRFSARTKDDVFRIGEAYLRTLPFDREPEGYGVYRTVNGEKKRRVWWTVYQHGPLGWMDDDYTKDRPQPHGHSCRKCVAVGRYLEKRYPRLRPTQSVSKIPSRARWEHLESVAREEPHSPYFSVKWAALDPR